MIERIGQDLRFAGRMFRRTPKFTVVAVLIMALSIAANVSVFSFVNALFLKELPGERRQPAGEGLRARRAFVVGRRTREIGIRRSGPSRNRS